MKLKDRLQDYTRSEFVTHIENIMKVDTSKNEHDGMIDHFDRVAGHPLGADLLIHPTPPDDFNEYDAEYIVQLIEQWHNDNGLTTFINDQDPPQQPAGPRPPLTAQEHALQGQSRHLAKVQALAAQVNDADIDTQSAFARVEAMLVATQTQTPLPGQQAEFSRLEGLLADFETARLEVSRCMQRYGALKLPIQFAKDATRYFVGGHYDSTLQASLVQQITSTSEQHEVRQSALTEHNRNLDAQAHAVIAAVEADLIRLATLASMGPLMGPNQFISNVGYLDAMPQVLTPYADISTAFDPVLPELKRSINSAVSGLAWDAVREADETSALYASVLSFTLDRPGCGEPFAVSVPLSEIAPTEGKDWHLLAANGGYAHLSYRLTSGIAAPTGGKLFRGIREVTEVTDVRVVSTHSPGVESRVAVLPAIWDADVEGYRVSRPGFPMNEVFWPGPLRSSSAPNPFPIRKRSTAVGYIAPTGVPVVQAIDGLEELTFDDCIVVFPMDSGIEPAYLMFKAASQYAGSAIGVGQTAGSGWPIEGNAGIPSQIADQLRGRAFHRLSAFRTAFWQAIANDAQLSVPFDAQDINDMQRGKAPFAPQREGHAQRTRLEVVYLVKPAQGGKLYDMDNMQVARRLLIQA
jgi:hypothetical protein